MHGFAKTNHVFPLKGTDGATKEMHGVACASIRSNFERKNVGYSDGGQK
jgi:hypothetical protein